MKFRQWLSDFFAGSAIIRALDRLGSFLYKRLGSGAYSHAFGSYDTLSETFASGAIGNGQNKTANRVRRFLAESIEESVYVTGTASVMRYLSRLSLRVIGVFMLSAGFYTLVAQLLLFLIWHDGVNVVNGIVAALMMVCGIPFCFFKKSFASAIYESAFLGWIARDICGFKERSFSLEAPPTGRKNAAFILGLPVGVLSCFISPILLIVLVIALLFAYIILLQPEFGYRMMLFALPFFVVLPNPSITLGLFAIYTFGCFAIKLIRGKRHFRLDLMDVFVVLFMLVMMLGGIISYGGMQSIKAAGVYVVLMLGYFLTVGMVNSKAELKKTVSILAVSLLLVSAYGLFQNFTGNISTEWIDTEMFDSIGGRVVSTFENPNMLGLYLILLLPFIVANGITEKNWWKKPGYLVAFAAGAACLIYTWARGAWLGFLFAAVIFMLMWNRKTMGVLLAGVLALPVMVPFLPESIVFRFSSIGDLTDTSTNYRVYIWRGSTNLLKDYWLTGIGVGEQAFDKIYPYYSFAGIEKAPHAHNLFLQLFIEVGIFGFAVFVILLICMFQNGFTLAKHGEDKAVRLMGCGALCGVVAALVQGMTDYVWYNYRVFFIFWVMIGLVAAARRIDYVLRSRKSGAYSEQSADITL